MPEIAVAELGHGELAKVVDIHLAAFPDSAITSLGRDAIRRYYAWLLDGPHDAKLVGAWAGSRLVGFCAAGVFRGALNGYLRANRRYLALHIARHPSLLFTPLIRDRIWLALKVTVTFSGRRSPSLAARATRASFGVLSIATARDARGLGVGRALMAEAEARARAQGFAAMNLTVHPTNAAAVRFYEQLGWARRIEEGVWRGSMQLRLDDV